jgi:hypothetical protein
MVFAKRERRKIGRDIILMAHPVLGHSLYKTIVKVFFTKGLQKNTLICLKTIMKKFFLLQYKANAHPGFIPVSSVDHPLDEKIPFKPSWVYIYLDFIEFWVQILGFLLKRYGKNGIKPVKDFIDTMTNLYLFAAEVYSKHMSTTNRPKYYKNLRFIIIHMTDPHLMCIPSLHVMVAIRAYTKFREIIQSFGDEENLSKEIHDMYDGSLRITESVLYVKQHSVNCISAAMYAMSHFDPKLFPPEEARNFAAQLFINQTEPNQADGNRIREHIISLYERFMQEGNETARWEEPLIRFLQATDNAV